VYVLPNDVLENAHIGTSEMSELLSTTINGRAWSTKSTRKRLVRGSVGWLNFVTVVACRSGDADRKAIWRPSAPKESGDDKEINNEVEASIVVAAAVEDDARIFK